MVKSRTELINLKEELKFLLESKEVFEEKRNLLLKEIMKIVDQIEEKRKKLNVTVLEGYKVVSKAIMEEGKENLLSRKSKTELELTVEKRVFAGIVVPKVHYKFKKEVEIDWNEGIFYKLTEKKFVEAVKLILEIAELEMTGWRLLEEIRKTTIRINAIDNHYVPERKESIKKLEEYLEEQERSEGALLKRWRSLSPSV